MTLIRWRPSRNLESIQDEVNRVFESFFNTPMRRRAEDVGGWYPDVDIVEDKDNIEVQVDLPGMEKDDIKVSVEDSVLTIKGERKGMREEKDKNYHQIERTYGTFTRSFSLPTTVEGEKIKASYKNGVLKIDLPKAEAVKPKEIPISVS
ncbi:MAG TPA: Hsp20/alpha crystallin family protein [candidate division Zixibacteria bacterium]|nr:Hsp20/alpha crystallin family protein [candidate division Zixibacteria bacterium]